MKRTIIGVVMLVASTIPSLSQEFHNEQEFMQAFNGQIAKTIHSGAGIKPETHCQTFSDLPGEICRRHWVYQAGNYS